jgi:hypothetical protein
MNVESVREICRGLTFIHHATFAYNRQVLIGSFGSFVGWSFGSFFVCCSFAVKRFWALRVNIYECLCCYISFHGMLFRDFGTYKINIYDYVCLILYVFPSFSMDSLLVFI